ncbi:glycosyltransferase [Nonomuraea sp. NPDC046570]|uniref:glycosyltransferase n=1 Tax=Nonomuraea sp. NPDC046570 TaxID=3155255 RepID=UPI0033D800D0
MTPASPPIRHNDYGSVEPPPIGDWRPELSVSVVIPAYDCQDALDRTLAALAVQTYPADLLDVVVADDGSRPALRVPPIAPARTRVVRVPEGWGRGAARQAGALAATGEVIHWLDSDMILDREHIEAHMRWHHVLGYAVVIGDIRFVPLPAPSAREVFEGSYLPPEGEGRAYTARIHAETRMLKDAGPSAYLVHTGATTSVPARLLRAAGGVDASLNMAEDTELGYRLAQAGAVFVPEPLARSWHVGESTVMRREKEVHRHNWSFLGDLIPELRWLRGHPRRQWRVPYVRVVVEAGGYEPTRATVDSALAGTLADVAVTLVGPWDKLTGERRSSLDDPMLETRLLHNLYRYEPRVDFAEAAPTTAAPTPFLLTVPAGWALGAETLHRLVRLADADIRGLISVALDEHETGVLTARLERTAAFARARLLTQDHHDDLVDQTFGSMWVSGQEYDFSTAAEAGPLAGDPAKWRAVATERQKEIKALTAEVARLTARVEELSAPPPDKDKDTGGGLGSLIRHLRSAG